MTVKPVRLQLSRRKGFDLQALSLATNGLPALVCARPGPLGNPFVVGVDGDAARCVELHAFLVAGLGICLTCVASVESQRAHLAYVRTHAAELGRNNLACWCRAGRPCHVNNLLRIGRR